jgi:N utilization substance protein A
MTALNVDETVGQLLASEGFRTVEDVAYSPANEIGGIDGFDDETAGELQRRALDYLAALEAERDARRKELGVEDEVREVPGVTTAMMVKLGEDGIKTVEDLAGCATDELAGWTERKVTEKFGERHSEVTKHAGLLDGMDLSRDEIETIIMAARVKAGWIEAPVAAPEAEGAAA